MLSKNFIFSMAVATSLSLPAFAFNLSPHTMTAEQNTAHIIQVSSEDTREQKAKQFIIDLAEQGIGFLEDQSLSDEQREKEFRNVLKNNFDMKTIARFALGRYWRSSTDEQKKEYLSLFEDMIVEVYSQRFSEYNGESFEVLSAREQGKSDAVVSSQIVPPSGTKVRVEWRVREKKGKMKIIDIMVEGVSMSLTQRSDFASVIQRGGGNVDVLLAHLRP